MLNELTRFDAARLALAAATTVDEVKDIRDKAAALQAYMAQSGATLEMQNHCADIKIRAERRAGELIFEMRESGELASIGRPEKRSHDAILNLSDVGIDRSQAHRWQQIATIPTNDFEKYIVGTKETGKELTTAGALKLAKKIAAINVDPIEDIDDAESDFECINSLEPLITAGRKFGCVYADPPWKYGNQATRASTDNHYGTMTVEEIMELPVAAVVAENAHIHLWTTNAFLFEAKRVLEAWGFEYRSCFVWVKPQMGIGNYWRVSHEFMLFGIRGKCPFRRRDCMSWMEIPRSRHSAKPDVVRQIIETTSPGPYLEMFGRMTLPNWTVFGNQVERSVFDVEAV